jgi:hypothetical protein
VTEGAHGLGVVELIDRILAGELAGIRHRTTTTPPTLTTIT